MFTSPYLLILLKFLYVWNAILSLFAYGNLGSPLGANSDTLLSINTSHLPFLLFSLLTHSSTCVMALPTFLPLYI